MEIKGKYITATVHTDNIEDAAISQIRDIVDSKAFEGQTVHYMPDVHASLNSTVGFTATLGDFINPLLIGGDAGCTVSHLILEKHLPVELYAEFEHRVRQAVPTGVDIQESPVIDEREFRKFLTTEFNRLRQQWPEHLSGLPVQVTEEWISDVLRRINMQEGIFYKSLGTLGSGNHMLEYGESSDGTHSGFTVHCGSRNFGQKICKYWTTIAQRGPEKGEVKQLRVKFKEIWRSEHGKSKDGYDAALQEFIKKETSGTQIEGYLTGDNMDAYLCDLAFGQLYARYNHMTIHRLVSAIFAKYGIGVKETIMCPHNYIDMRDHILRKGAIAAYKDEKVIIPFNMRDGVAICTGKSNPDWNFSGPHGAGRSMSRAQAKKRLSMDEYKASMDGVFSTSICQGTLDESPMAYKPTDEIKSLITPTVDILYMLPSKINFKAFNNTENGD